MKLNDYKLVFAAVGLIGILLIALPAIAVAFHLPSEEQFSELYLLGPGGMAENYPFNVGVGQNYSVFVGVGNNLGSAGYYVVYVKFRNQSDLLPNATTGIPCPLEPLYEYRFALQDGAYWNSPLTFSILDASVAGNESMIRQLMLNNVVFDVNKAAVWDSNSNIFPYQLVFELWLFDEHSGSVRFNNRFVNLCLNFTETS